MGDRCGDNRFEIIKKAKAELIKSTNIETSEDEMKVLDNFLFRCWQMDWLERYDKPREPLDIPTISTDFVKEQGLPCPEGYIFKDENGNVINATKIVLEKKKKEYPKTYEECCKVMDCAIHPYITADEPGIISYYEDDLNRKVLSLRKLLICRDAYWKIAGEEMGLGKGLPWVPDWMCIDPIYVILYQYHAIYKAEVNGGTSCILAFPTEEMRDAFKENFDPDIEICKELL